MHLIAQEPALPDFCPEDYSRQTRSLMASRTLESHGEFVLPWLHPGQRVLDCGCGPGTITTELAEAVFPGRVTGVDQLASETETAGRLAQGREVINADFARADIHVLPFRKETFDLAFAHSLFEHLARPLAALQEMRRVLRPGGFIALCSPDWGESMLDPLPDDIRRATDLHRALIERNGGDSCAGAQLARWVEAAGFRLLEEQTRHEFHANPSARIGQMAIGLDAEGFAADARALRRWHRQGGRFFEAWTSVVAVSGRM